MKDGEVVLVLEVPVWWCSGITSHLSYLHAALRLEDKYIRWHDSDHWRRIVMRNVLGLTRGVSREFCLTTV